MGLRSIYYTHIENVPTSRMYVHINIAALEQEGTKYELKETPNADLIITVKLRKEQGAKGCYQQDPTWRVRAVHLCICISSLGRSAIGEYMCS